MGSIDSLLAALDERTIAREIGIRHDEARMQFALERNTVGTMDEFEHVTGLYYAYHHSRCIAIGGAIPASQARSAAKEIIERAYRQQRRGGYLDAFHDAHDGTSGGLRSICDLIAEHLKGQAVEYYIRDVFDRHVAKNSWEQQVEIIRQFITACGRFLSPSIRRDQPERYARDYEELVRSYTSGLQQTSNIFRRL
jgi:hypothetical protein